MGEIHDRFINQVAAGIVDNLRNEDTVYSTASGIVLGLQLASLHPEYGMALLQICHKFLGNEARDRAFVENMVMNVPLETVDD